MKFYLNSGKVTDDKCPMKQYPVFSWFFFFNKTYFTTGDENTLHFVLRKYPRVNPIT